LNAIAIKHSISIDAAGACFDGGADAIRRTGLAVLKVEELIFIAKIVRLLIC
jgi:hypothetical protein